MIDIVKKFWNNRPCNIQHSPYPVGSLAWSLGVSKRKYFVEPHIRSFAKFWDWRGKKVLELGCGIGSDSEEFVLGGAKITMVDISGEALKLAKNRLALHYLAPVAMCEGDIEKLSAFVPVEPYALIYSFGVIHHTPEPKNVIKEIVKYCDKNTTVKIMLYHKYSWKVFWILFWHFGWFNPKKYIAKYAEAQVGCPVAYSKKEAEELLKPLKVISMKVAHIFPYKIKDYVQYRYVKEWYWCIIPKRLFQWLESKIGWHLLIEAKL
jgi:SAM-dependent methyltransferase